MLSFYCHSYKLPIVIGISCIWACLVFLFLLLLDKLFFFWSFFLFISLLRLYLNCFWFNLIFCLFSSCFFVHITLLYLSSVSHSTSARFFIFLLHSTAIYLLLVSLAFDSPFTSASVSFSPLSFVHLPLASIYSVSRSSTSLTVGPSLLSLLLLLLLTFQLYLQLTFLLAQVHIPCTFFCRVPFLHLIIFLAFFFCVLIFLTVLYNVYCTPFPLLLLLLLFIVCSSLCCTSSFF